LINVLSTIEDALVVLIFVEQPAGAVKVSWRARPGIDVSPVALRLVEAGTRLRPALRSGSLEEVRRWSSRQQELLAAALQKG
jgi:phosphoesterase RecJ-like protein